MASTGVAKVKALAAARGGACSSTSFAGIMVPSVLFMAPQPFGGSGAGFGGSGAGCNQSESTPTLLYRCMYS